MTHCRITCSIRSTHPTPSMQILSILWLQDMYHKGRIKESSFIRVVITYGMRHTSSESAKTDSLEDMHQLKK
jgi:hypothetical protein